MSAQRRKVQPGTKCQVCQDEATGWHYGVESCKTFFRRTVVSGHQFTCQYDGNCEISKNVRCACRHCRFSKCYAVGMDSNAIQNDRDRIGPTKKQKNNVKAEAADDDAATIDSSSSNCSQEGDKLIEELKATEDHCNDLRTKVFPEHKTVKETLLSPCLLYNSWSLLTDQNTLFKDLYPASMNDIQMWNIRELRLCLEWVKSFSDFTALGLDDQFALVHNFAFTFNILNRVFYSYDQGPDKIVYPNGAYILRQPQESVRIPGCRSIYHRQMDEIMVPFRKMQITTDEFSLFKALLLFNPDACDLSISAKSEVECVRERYLNSLFNYIVSRHGVIPGGLRFGSILLMTSSIQQIIAQNDENMQVMEVFGHFWRIDQFVKELCMKSQH